MNFVNKTNKDHTHEECRQVQVRLFFLFEIKTRSALAKYSLQKKDL
jgi:hypothetical protein